MVKIQFYPLDITYKEQEGKAVIHLFGRMSNGERILVLDRKFEPYFYVLLKPTANAEQFRNDLSNIKIGEKEDAFVTKTETVEKIYFGKKMSALKVYANLPRSVPVLRSYLKTNPDVNMILESDITFTRRYLIDKKIIPLSLCEVDGNEASVRTKAKIAVEADEIKQISDEIIEKPKILAFDIETYSPEKRIIPEQNPILMIAFHDEHDFRKVITWKKFKTKLDYIEFVNSEADLLERFKQVIDEYKPDFLAGYFSDGFDFPYIKIRADKYKIKLNLGIDFSNITFGKGKKKTAQITGIIHFDVFKYVSRILGRTLETESYRLDLVASELLGEGKYDIDIGELHSVWDEKNAKPEDLERFCIYNLQDASLTLKLAKKTLPNIIELVKIVGLSVYDVNRMGSSQIVEWYLIKQASEYKQLAPNKPEYNETRARIESTFSGAFVFEPKPGLYKDIAIFDYRSLYPSIISSHNISPGTLDCECCENEQDFVPMDKDDRERHWFCKKKKGFIPVIIEELIKRRMRIKEMMKTGDAEKNIFLEARQQALKLMANSFYGYLGFFGARWYSLESAKSVTSYGRFYIQKVISQAHEKGFPILYGDTDSIFLSLEGKDIKDAENFSEEINRELPGIMELEFEGVYPAGIFVSAKASAKEASYGAKKKYALLDKKGLIRVKGFEAVRRNWSFIARDVQEKVLEIVLKQGSDEKAGEKAGEKALEYVKEIIKNLKEHKIPLEKVQIFTQLQKDISEYESLGPHVKVAMRMKAKGIEIGPGSMISYIVTVGKERIGDRARLIEEITQDDYDADYYINNQVIPAVDRILAIFGYEKDDLLGEKEQSKLGDFGG